MNPGASASVSQPMEPDTKYVAIVAFYRDPDSKGAWRQVVPKKKLPADAPLKLDLVDREPGRSHGSSQIEAGVMKATATAAQSARVPEQIRVQVQHALKEMPGAGESRAPDYRARVWAATRKIALAWSGQCLSPVYEGSRARHEFECADGHHFQLSIVVLRRGGWCQACHYARMTVHSIDEARALAAQHGGLCLSTSYEHSRAKLRWRCTAGHEWLAPIESVLRGTGASPAISRASSRPMKISIARQSNEAGDACPRMSTRRRRSRGNAPRGTRGPRHGFA